jgi:glycosyltransferase involved in cell wall biosynthesis
VGSEDGRLLFVGNFGHPPNVDAAFRLTRDILPAVRRGGLSVQLDLVGDNPPPELREMASPVVNVTGRVPDVTPYLDRASLVVVPLRMGGGMRVKVLEALGAGKAVVASHLATEGLDLVDGQHVVHAETDDEFAARTQTDAGDQRAGVGPGKPWPRTPGRRVREAVRDSSRRFGRSGYPR